MLNIDLLLSLGQDGRVVNGVITGAEVLFARLHCVDVALVVDNAGFHADALGIVSEVEVSALELDR